MAEGKYKRIEITFNKDDECEMEIYEYIVKNSSRINKAKWIKNLVRKEMIKSTKK